MEHLWGWLCLLLLPGIWVLLVYNSLVNHRNQVRLAFATIDVQLKKRFDLVPNLVETVRGYAEHEREALENVTLARNHAAAPGADWQAQETLQHSLGILVARAEAYPDLKASAHFLMLQRQLSECEAQIAAARRTYNASVMDYNNTVEMFPSSLVAGIFRFARKPEFEIAIAEREAPDVRF
ncbi:LemA family protein [Akkermansiaceae bacterium]|nr:LemA family protein [Akkermansiaceae bacterium]